MSEVESEIQTLTNTLEVAPLVIVLGRLASLEAVADATGSETP